MKALIAVLLASWCVCGASLSTKFRLNAEKEARDEGMIVVTGTVGQGGTLNVQRHFSNDAPSANADFDDACTSLDGPDCTPAKKREERERREAIAQFSGSSQEME
eukprot:CAMPEP_0113892860 /NCGR_PEP_ID=MMETSP0780_2-20120614/15697_1 /TAXON_ID=652834 /ORGANISM="Palpitomonas bilix" /LENGTH=104 /DNA_ID=CAMNT_0000882937 /DNA_START=174 /DNA_END=485 /DNA_ORIENTATION=- /assembly_acc=CAM_ASM_000599